LVWSIISPRRRQRLIEDASESRSHDGRRAVAIAAVVTYNIIGVLDIISTSIGIGSGIAEEANPVLAQMMENLGSGWIGAKLFLQAVISVMVLWFPHRLVLGMFVVAIIFNVFIVLNNFRIILGHWPLM